MIKMDGTKELQKMNEVKDKSQLIGEFLDWLMNEKGCVIAEYSDSEIYVYKPLIPNRLSIEQLLAEYFDIDLEKAERERVELLERFRKANPLEIKD